MFNDFWKRLDESYCRWVLRPKVVGGHVSFSQWEYVYVGRPVWKKYKVKIPIYKWKYSKIHINSKKYV